MNNYNFNPELFEEVKESERLDYKKKRQEIINLLLTNYRFATLPNDKIYVYQDGIYTENVEKIIRQATVYAMGLDYSREDYANILDRIKAQTMEDTDFFDAPPNLIAVQNGILDIYDNRTVNNMWVTEYSAKQPKSIGLGNINSRYHFLNKLKASYDDRIFSDKYSWTHKGEEYNDPIETVAYTKSNPLTGQLIYEILPSRQAVRCFYELLGYVLYRGYPIHKAFMFVGEGSNGKSTLLNIIKDFIGQENTCSISLQSLCTDRFSKAELFGKKFNFLSDLKDMALTETGDFKALTGGDQISAEIKFTQKRLTFTNWAKFAFSANKIPENKGDDSDAFWRRWIIIQCTQTFDEEKGNVKHDILDTLFERGYSVQKEKEYEALLVHALLGLKRLLKYGKFSSDGIIVIDGKEKVRDAWTRNDTVRGFVEECIEPASNGYETKPVIFEAYIKWQNRTCPNMPPLDMGVFHRKLRKYVAVYDTQKTIDGQRVNCYGGIKLKVEEPNEHQKKL
jgi:P4 family phage/plasmid primase-like protien